MTELEVNVPPAESVPVEALKIDNENPNRMSTRRLEALKKSIQRYGFVVPIITNKDLLVADGEHRLKAAKALGMKQVSVVRLPVDEVDRRLIRQVMNKLRGEHDLFMDAEEYYRIVCGDKRDVLKALLNETDLRIDNLLKLREPAVYSDADLKALALKFGSRVESNKLEGELERQHFGEPLTLKCHVEFSTKAEVTERTLAVCEAFGLGVDEAKRFVVFDNFCLEFRRGDLVYVTGDSGGGKTLLLKTFKSYFGDEAIELSDLQVDPEETLIEGVGTNVKEAIEILSLCGLNDAFLFLRKYKELSDGQKYRYKLAKLVNCREKTVWLVDEFCASLDRIMAKIVAFLFQKIARKLGKTVIVATTHGDLVEDFQPDVIVEKGFENDAKVSRNEMKPKPCSLLDKVHVEKGGVEDYEKLKMANWLDAAEEAWKKNATETSLKNFPTPMDRVNYHNGLILQKQITRYFVVYTGSGTHIAAAVVDTRRMPQLHVGNVKISPVGFVADYKTYWFGTNNEEEADYLAAILNSETLDQIIKPHQSRGKFGPRDICRLPFEFNIPQFDSNCKFHKQIAALGLKAAKEAVSLPKTSRLKMKTAIPSMKEIDKLVSELLNA
jgi:ABC-type transport system involved in cytochrome c biogenesis ATPase subunit